MARLELHSSYTWYQVPLLLFRNPLQQAQLHVLLVQRHSILVMRYVLPKFTLFRKYFFSIFLFIIVISSVCSGLIFVFWQILKNFKKIFIIIKFFIKILGVPNFEILHSQRSKQPFSLSEEGYLLNRNAEKKKKITYGEISNNWAYNHSNNNIWPMVLRIKNTRIRYIWPTTKQNSLQKSTNNNYVILTRYSAL